MIWDGAQWKYSASSLRFSSTSTCSSCSGSSTYSGSTASSICGFSTDGSVFETPDGSYLVTNGDDAYDRAVYSAEEIISDLGPYGAIQNEYIEYWLEDVVNEDEIDEILEEEIDYLESEDEEGADSVREIAESGTIYDKINYLEDMGFNFKNRDTEIFDYHKLAEKCVDEDGPAHYLATYDGKEIDLGNGLYAYKVD